uniref:Uncharacterized protein n=1 Tax=Arundo donax TaxID=35708 RepID=A0A0A9CR64_ARUDO
MNGHQVRNQTYYIYNIRLPFYMYDRFVDKCNCIFITPIHLVLISTASTIYYCRISKQQRNFTCSSCLSLH